MTDGAGDGGGPWPLTARTATVLVAAAAAVAVATVHADVFPHRSVNHDEAVYLQQAALLLDGQLAMQAGPLADAVRPWFFVQDGGTLYAKYTPVTAGVFAAAKLLTGSYAAALPAVAFANVYVGARLVAAAFDDRTGLLAAALVAASPLFLVTSATFLSYAPATAFNLVFALAYVRAARRRSLRWAVLSGLAVGLAFFARSYTAVLFAAPFVGHALAATLGAWRARDGPALRAVVTRNAVVAGLGTAFVALALAYNWRLTGDPLVFPYEAFAPEDGIGFGHREILAHERDYTVALGLEANARVLWAFATDWFVAPPAGVVLALVGLGAVLRRAWRRGRPALPRAALPSSSLRALLAAVVASVVLGNVAFWGNLNILGRVDVAGDGLVAALGPFYHFDLLVPLAGFGAHAALLAGDRLLPALRERSSRPAVAVALAVLLAVAPLAALSAGAAAVPLERNAANTERLAGAYEPFDGRELEGALVYVPTPYGDWLNHPFQRLRNDPGLDGEVVYALDRSAAEDFRVLDAFPERQPYRYTYRGEWSGDPDARVTGALQRLRVVEGERVDVRTTLGVPRTAAVSSVRLSADGETATADPPPVRRGETAVEWVVGPERARVLSEDGGAASVPLDGTTELTLAVTLTQPGGATLTYHLELAVDAGDDAVRVLWPPERRVCRLTTDCGHEGTYLPDDPDAHLSGVSVNGTVETE